MTTFLIGLVILFVGGAIYSQVCVNVMKPDDRKTPAFTDTDGVDYVPMKKWRNSLINLLNIAGTGPIIGPIQGVLFGPIAFILIPVGCVLGGAMHDYFSGMLALRNRGMQMPELVKKYTNNVVYNIYNVYVCFLMLLVGAVFIYTPGDILAKQLLGLSGEASDPTTWIIYGLIFVYYLGATVLPIDKLIGKIYPIFGLILVFSALGIFAGVFVKDYQLTELSLANWKGIYPMYFAGKITPATSNLIPAFFITVACGIVSGFHSTQTAIISRSVMKEKEGRMTFYNMMILEGFIAMIWAAAAMGAYAKAAAAGANPLSATDVIGAVAFDMLGSVGGILALLGVVVLPITSGDTALRSLRLMVSEFLHIDQKPAKNRLTISAVIFILVAVILWWSKTSAGGFMILWRYFAWGNQTIATFAFAIITIYLLGKGYKMAALMSLLPGAWYIFITFSFICYAPIGFNLPMNTSYILGVVFALIYTFLIYQQGTKLYERKTPLEAVPVLS
jgi:carbon starvation protein CstA